MTDRGQMGPSDLRLALPLVVVAVLAVVIAEVREEVGAVEEPVAYCGLCHVDWRPAAALLIIGGLVAIAAHTVPFYKPPEENGDAET
jgi:hypothetical protein